jgi:hypothetical protein
MADKFIFENMNVANLRMDAEKLAWIELTDYDLLEETKAEYREDKQWVDDKSPELPLADAFDAIRNGIGKSVEQWYGSTDVCAYIAAIRGDDDSEEFKSLWVKVGRDDLDYDVEIEKYKGWKIFLAIPNGGILGVSVSKHEAFSCPTDIWHKEIERLLRLKGNDESWHIEIAKRFIDSMQPQLASR